MVDSFSFIAANLKLDYFEAQCNSCPKSFTSETSFSMGIREALIERKKTVKKYFKCEETTFEGSKDGEVLERHLVYTEDLDTLIDLICFERSIDKDSSEIAVV